MSDYAIRPDYDRGIVVINRQQASYTCPSDGWIMYQSGGTTQTGSSFYINDNFISRSSSNFWCGSCFVPVESQDIVRLGEDSYGQISFFPYKN